LHVSPARSQLHDSSSLIPVTAGSRMTYGRCLKPQPTEELPTSIRYIIRDLVTASNRSYCTQDHYNPAVYPAPFQNQDSTWILKYLKLPPNNLHPLQLSLPSITYSEFTFPKHNRHHGLRQQTHRQRQQQPASKPAAHAGLILFRRAEVERRLPRWHWRQAELCCWRRQGV
jgi:hypothetical protein